MMVKTKDGKIGRTYKSKGMIKDKVPVYLATRFKTGVPGMEIPIEYMEEALLCAPDTLTIIGFID